MKIKVHILIIIFRESITKECNLHSRMCKLCQKDKTADDEHFNNLHQSGGDVSSPPNLLPSHEESPNLLPSAEDGEQQPPPAPPLLLQPHQQQQPPQLLQQPLPQLLMHHIEPSSSNSALTTTVIEKSAFVSEVAINSGVEQKNVHSSLTTTTTVELAGGHQENVSDEQITSDAEISTCSPATLHSSTFDQSSASFSSINSVALATFLQVPSFQEFDNETLDPDYIGDNIVGFFNENKDHVFGKNRNFSEMYGKVFLVRRLSTTTATSSEDSGGCCDIGIIWKCDENDTACLVERLAVKDYDVLVEQR